MARKTLPVNPSIVTQETYYQCGPATVQNAIWAKQRRVVSESQLARELGTTVNGTDYIGYLDRVVGNHLGVNHETQNIPNDPPTAAQRDTFWVRLKGAVDAGFGLPMNWIAPPGNYPRAVEGTSPSYGGGTVYHYVLAGGYDDTSGRRWVFVIDSGFQPKTYWITLAQCVSLIAGKGYAYPILAAPKPPAPNATLVDAMNQLAGAPGYKGWPQLGGRTVTDAVAVILKELS